MSRQQIVCAAMAVARTWATMPGDVPLPDGAVAATRLALFTSDGENAPEACVALEVTETDGTRHVLIAGDEPERVGELHLPDRCLVLRGSACYLRHDPAGRLTYAALLHGLLLQAEGLTLALHHPTDFYEIAWQDGERLL